MDAKLTPEEVRAARKSLSLSASKAAMIFGIYDGAAWRKWEQKGVSGPGAKLLTAMLESRAVRQHFGLSLAED